MMLRHYLSSPPRSCFELIVVSMGALSIAFIAYVWPCYLQQTGMTDFYGLSFEAVLAIGLLLFLFALGEFVAYKSFRKVSVGLESMIGEPAVVTLGWELWQNEYEGEDYRQPQPKNSRSVIYVSSRI